MGQVVRSESIKVDFNLLRDWKAGNIHIRAQVLWTLTPVPILSVCVVESSVQKQC
jgi:hypothetical protein